MNKPWTIPHSQPWTRNVLAIAAGIGGETGVPFLERLVLALRDCMDADAVLLTTREGQSNGTVRARYALLDGAVADGITYALDGAPCARVYAGEQVVIPCGLAEAFPREAGFQGYVGVPIRHEDGTVWGALTVLSANPVADPDGAEAILQIFAHRVEAELRHEEHDRRRETLIEKLSQRNARLAAQYRKLREANAFKTRLIGLIAHDLRNPLAAILSQAELISSHAERLPTPAPRIAAGCEKVVVIAERMNAMIAATLARVRADSDGLSPLPAPCDLASVARMAADVNRLESARKSISVSVDAPENVPVVADEDLILQAVDNLVGNAIKYTHPGGRVEISAKGDLAGATIRVCDTGQGLTPFDLSRVFGRYETLSAKPTGGEKAVGLGLANVQDILSAHGGKVTAESPGKDRGSVFTVWIPAHTALQ